MRFLLIGAAVLAAVSALAFTGTTARPPSHPVPAWNSGGSLLLTVQIDARGVSILQCTQKPELRYRAPRSANPPPFRWVLRAADGKDMATGRFDPGLLDLDPRHRGTLGRVIGDHLIPTETAMNIKVPALPFHSIEFEREKSGAFEAFGSAVVGEFPVRGDDR